MVLKSKTCLLLLYSLYLLCIASVTYSNKYGEPEQELHKCQLSCVKQLQPYSKQAECQEQCVKVYKERKEERGSLDDPQGKFKRCQKQCQEQEQSQQQQCRRTCQEEYEQQQREQEERARQEGGEGRGDENPQIEDPRQRYEKCQEECRSSRGGEQQECRTQCRKEYERRQREQEEREHREGGRGRDDYNPQVPRSKDPRQRYEQCQEQCRSSHRGEQQQQCQTQCKKEYERQHREGGTGRGDDGSHVEQRHQQCQQKCQSQERGQQRQYCLQQCEIKYREEQREEGHKHGEEDNISGREEERQENNPYYFQAQRFESTFKTQEGHLRVLERFSERSELLQGIDNYRLALLEANPNTFIIPHHYDAESVFAVLQGKGIITLVQQDGRESFNLKQGDVIRVPAGTTLYLINHDNNEKLHVAKLFQPVNTPGQFESFFGAGGENPESFYRAFSNEVLQAALNTPREKLERLFGQQKQGVIIRASQEQIKALSRHVSSSSSRKSKGPFSLLKEKPLFSNEFGEFFEASPDNYDQLRNLDLSVAFMNINQGAMIAPYYNSKSTKLVMVVEGTGRFEMACPHLTRQTHVSQGRSEQQREGTQYQKVSAQLSVGDAFIIPAGHPISIIVSGNEDLKLFGFGINAKNNQKNFLAGQEDNVWKHLQSEAKELSFQLPAREVEEIFSNQKQSYFLPGPGQHQEREEGGRSHTVASKLMDFVDFFQVKPKPLCSDLPLRNDLCY